MSTEPVISLGSHWRPTDRLKYLVVFGASYCDIGYNAKRSPRPSKEVPLGVIFPGDTFNEPGKPNWVGHYAEKYSRGSDLLVFDYAIGGSQVGDLAYQIKTQFMPFLGQKPDWAPWTAENALFMSWIGINDCGWNMARGKNKKSVEALFEQQNVLYKAGARNFVLFEVPPCHRSPMGISNSALTENLYASWNEFLHAGAHDFAAQHADASVIIFPSWALFNTLLDDPVGHGFAREDVSKEGGAIWFDHLHPTSAVHEMIARELAVLLDGAVVSDEAGVVAK